jgi:hypothetical protein
LYVYGNHIEFSQLVGIEKSQIRSPMVVYTERVLGEFETAFDGEIEAIADIMEMQLTIRFEAFSPFIPMLKQ